MPPSSGSVTVSTADTLTPRCLRKLALTRATHVTARGRPGASSETERVDGRDVQTGLQPSGLNQPPKADWFGPAGPAIAISGAALPLAAQREILTLGPVGAFASGWARRSMVIVAVQVHDNPDKQRYEAVVDGELAGFAAYRTQPALISFVHTEVDDAFERHGIASTLIREALEDARRRGFEVLPFCPFVKSFIAEHREFVDLVPASRREEFGL